MRGSSPRQLAVLLAVVASVTTVAAGLVVQVFKETSFIISMLFIALVVFFTVYLIVFYSLNNFIIEKIKPVYKTIFNLSQAEEKLKTDIEDRDIIQNVQDDVMQWARIKTREISQLKQLEKYRREFLGNVSHELKTPIFNIQGYILTLLDGGLEDENINRRYLEKAEKSVNRLISIINDLESISRLESGELQLEYQRFDMVKLIEEIFEEQDRLAHERNIKLRLSHNSDKPVYVYADRKRILEALSNLIVNSIKYGKSGGHTLVEFLDMDDNIVVEVADNGIGISEKDLPRIFERFYRTDKSRSREMGGTGLGLSIVKHIIEAHNQTINVQSKPDKGSSFAFTLRKG
jgi:two-component system phosphate regulon sensor histidine kinase PhoR